MRGEAQLNTRPHNLSYSAEEDCNIDVTLATAAVCSSSGLCSQGASTAEKSPCKRFSLNRTYNIYISSNNLFAHALHLGTLLELAAHGDVWATRTLSLAHVKVAAHRPAHRGLPHQSQSTRHKHASGSERSMRKRRADSGQASRHKAGQHPRQGSP